MKLCNPDGEASIEIAKNIRKRSKATGNHLSSLLKMRFTAALKYHCIQEINDFPKLTLNQFYKQVTFSSFKLRQCQSYLEQLIINGKVHCLDESGIKNFLSNDNVLEDLNHTKFIAVQIPSRHKHSRKKNAVKNNKMDTNSFSN
jgi:hypothetical protein